MWSCYGYATLIGDRGFPSRCGSFVTSAIGVSILLFATVSTSEASPASKVARRCPRGRLPGQIVSNSQAQVYEVHGVLFGCVYRHRSYSLGPVQGPGGEETVKALTGATVAIERFKHDGNPLIVVSDIRTGRVMRKLHTGGPPRSHPCWICDGVAVALVLKEDGSLAWLTEDGRFDYSTELHAADRNGSRILAYGTKFEGTEIDDRSLVVDKSTLHWMQGGRPMSAPLN